jgi:putative transposase
VVQRGNNREACFIEPENYQFYLVLWEELSRRYGLKAHAYCLMTNHVHVLVTPENAQYINKKDRRTGTLWEGWHRASLVQSERYLLTPPCATSNSIPCGPRW